MLPPCLVPALPTTMMWMETVHGRRMQRMSMLVALEMVTMASASSRLPSAKTLPATASGRYVFRIAK